jgi:prepilin-type N-terminal cleavage/methylation domain-containing protein
MRKTPHHPTPRGFTLVELLVVIVIVAALAALGFQGYRSARLGANKAVSTANLRQLAAANLLYAVDRQTYAPATDIPNLIRWHGGRTSVSSKFDPTKGYLSEYLGESRRVGICPEFKEHLTGSSSWEDGSGGYGYNAIYIGGLPGDWTTPNRPANVNNPARTIMFATTALAKARGIQEYASADPPREVYASWRLGPLMQPSVHFRFNGRALIAWCDGHITEERSQGKAERNIYGGNNKEANIGFCGPTENNGWWNPRN